MGASEARILLEGNAFTLWLGGRLTALGYQVFADVLRLKGGDDWERVLEDAIRNKAKRFLLVATPGGVQKQGVRNEITIAIETAKRIKEDGFIVPLRLAAYAAPLQIAHAQYIDFEKGWAKGLAELLPLLEEADVPKSAAADNAKTWQSLQLKDARTVGSGPETLISNWLSIEALPPGGFPMECSHPWRPVSSIPCSINPTAPASQKDCFAKFRHATKHPKERTSSCERSVKALFGRPCWPRWRGWKPTRFPVSSVKRRRSRPFWHAPNL